MKMGEERIINILILIYYLNIVEYFYNIYTLNDFYFIG